MYDAFSGARSGRRPVRWLALSLLTALLALAPGAAHAGWSKPAPLGRGSGGVGGPLVGIDRHGTSYAVWDIQHDPAFGGTGSLRVRVRPAGGDWDRARLLLKQQSFELDDAVVARDGTLTILWTSPAGDHYHPDTPATLHASTRSPDGTWSEAIVSGAAHAPTAAVNARGDVIAAWSTKTGVGASYRPAGGSWGPVETVWGTATTDPYPSTPIVERVQVGLSRSGDASVAWTDAPPAGDPSACPGQCGLLTASRSPDGSWAAPTTLSTTSDDFFSFVAGTHGDTAIAWHDPTSHTIDVAVRPVGSAWGSPHLLAAVDAYPVAAVGPAGLTTVLWVSDHVVHSANKPTDGAWTLTEVAPSTGNGAISLTSAPDGTLLASWAQRHLASASMRGADGRWTDPQQVPAVGSGAITRNGRAVLGGLVTVGDREVPTLTSYDPRRAAFGFVKVPSHARPHRRLTFSATVGSWLPATITWHFGDRHRATGPRTHHSYRAPGSYRVRVRITDTSGSTRTVTRHVHIR